MLISLSNHAAMGEIYTKEYVNQSEVRRLKDDIPLKMLITNKNDHSPPTPIFSPG